MRDNALNVGLLVGAESDVLTATEAAAREVEGADSDAKGQEESDELIGVGAAAGVAVEVEAAWELMQAVSLGGEVVGTGERLTQAVVHLEILAHPVHPSEDEVIRRKLSVHRVRCSRRAYHCVHQRVPHPPSALPFAMRFPFAESQYY
jgi:hypothetical protein